MVKIVNLEFGRRQWEILVVCLTMEYIRCISNPECKAYAAELKAVMLKISEATVLYPEDFE